MNAHSAEKDALLAAVRDLLRTADQPTSHSATARVNAGALDRLRAAERNIPPGVCMCPEPAAIGTEPCDTCGLPAIRPLPPSVGA